MEGLCYDRVVYLPEVISVISAACINHLLIKHSTTGARRRLQYPLRLLISHYKFILLINASINALSPRYIMRRKLSTWHEYQNQSLWINKLFQLMYTNIYNIKSLMLSDSISQSYMYPFYQMDICLVVFLLFLCLFAIVPVYLLLSTINNNA